MKANLDNGNQRVVAYLLLLAVQITGALVFIWKELPAFNQLLHNPGQQLPYLPYDDLTTVAFCWSCKLRIGIACDAFQFRFSGRALS
jgi:hypothetical protein